MAIIRIPEQFDTIDTQMTLKKLRLPKTLPYLLIIIGIAGYICASLLLFDKIQLLKNPNYIPSCNLNPVLSCGSVMLSKQGQIFSVPSMYIGFGAFTSIGVIGVAMLAGAKMKRWFWLGLQLGVTLGALAVTGLFLDSVYVIHALCPICMIIWVLTFTAFWYVSLYNIDSGHISLPKDRARSVYAWVRQHHVDLLILWFLIIAALILKQFWYYYGQYF